ncbi:MAG: hypothetical protein AVDCRST_MAG05-597, partial [uncultured Rubrobacteraceae bacterium]
DQSQRGPTRQTRCRRTGPDRPDGGDHGRRGARRGRAGRRRAAHRCPPGLGGLRDLAAPRPAGGGAPDGAPRLRADGRRPSPSRRRPRFLGAFARLRTCEPRARRRARRGLRPRRHHPRLDPVLRAGQRGRRDLPRRVRRGQL